MGPTFSTSSSIRLAIGVVRVEKRMPEFPAQHRKGRHTWSVMVVLSGTGIELPEYHLHAA
jgi:hypothetical protein